MKRVSVIGSTGSGKTTVARAVAERLGTRHLELDSLFHLPGWSQKDDHRFRHVRDKYQRCLGDGTWGHATVHRLRSASDVEEFLESVRR